MKRVLGVTLIAVVMMSFLGFVPEPWQTAQAATEGNFVYIISDGKATITGYHGYEYGKITIPSALDGCPVTVIGDRAFYDLRNITAGQRYNHWDLCLWRCRRHESIIIPNSVISIGDRAFYDCKSLRWIDLGESATSIGTLAFYRCIHLFFITIPRCVTSIGDGAFSYCEKLTAVTIPDSVTTIGEYAFCECVNLTAVNIPGSVTSIGSGAFEGCSEDLTIYGDAGSYAEAFAEENDIPFVNGRADEADYIALITGYGLTDEGFVVSGVVWNKNESPLECVCIAAVYRDDNENGERLIKIAKQSVSAEGNNSAGFEINFGDFSPVERDTIKLFVWDGIGSINPVCPSDYIHIRTYYIHIRTYDEYYERYEDDCE